MELIVVAAAMLTASHSPYDNSVSPTQSAALFIFQIRPPAKISRLMIAISSGYIRLISPPFSPSAPIASMSGNVTSRCEAARLTVLRQPSAALVRKQPVQLATSGLRRASCPAAGDHFLPFRSELRLPRSRHSPVALESPIPVLSCFHRVRGERCRY